MWRTAAKHPPRLVDAHLSLVLVRAFILDVRAFGAMHQRRPVDGQQAFVCHRRRVEYIHRLLAQLGFSLQ